MFFVLEILLLVSTAFFASAMPSWDAAYGARPQVSIGNLVPGATLIEALGHGISFDQYKPKYLSIAAPAKGTRSAIAVCAALETEMSMPGLPGDAVIYENRSPPLFYINKGQLWQMTNQTSILRVNVVNVTDSALDPLPLKLEVGETKKGISGGEWHWRGTMLFYDLGSQSNKGLFYNCRLTNGKKAVYLSLEE